MKILFVEEPLLERTITEREALRALVRPFQDLLRVVPADVYARDWGHAFPLRAVQRLQTHLESLGPTD